ncbi:threo-3-hydroxy-L-aspartate ammonia-lyase [Simplicispira lacusdiani]|uniref:threo-3-hydroxy-L-aspartate ammonia-lyase n=1 Tax=Simplicispira lacusdiani TaxID=2213010 RepID=UPI000E7330FF|nr:threo-3-hydroxy-L-aspartate ammonia-lyase [Simplicispira lacusdiani]
MTTLLSQLQPTAQDVINAAHHLKGLVHRTPVLRSSTADEMLGAQLFFKCENLQRTGAFKFRGAFNALSQFDDEQRERGVITFSAGNHAQAIALAARLLDMPALILMPEDAPASKMAATRQYGAQVATYNPVTEDRETICQRLALERGMTLVPPSEHIHVIAGQGTAALELLEEVPRLDYLFVGVGGGGQLAGSLLAAKAVAPLCRVYGVEPEAGNDGQQSLRAGHIVRIPYPRSTIADGAQAQALGPLAFDIIQREAEGIVTASDPQLVQAMRFFAERMKIVVEPTGALAFAGAQHAGVDIRGARVGIIISGGNVDLPRYARFLAD